MTNDSSFESKEGRIDAIPALILLLLPLLFLPDLGLNVNTALGTLKISDFIIVPLTLLMFVTPRREDGIDRNMSGISRLMIIFSWWALIVTLLFPMRYNYSSNTELYFSILKLAKLLLYGMFGIFIASILKSDKEWNWFNWSIVVSGFLAGLNLIAFRLHLVRPDSIVALNEQVYTGNLVSVMLAIIASYVLALLLQKHGSHRWRLAATTALVIMAFGMFVSGGRGGWLAMLASLLYISLRQKRRYAVIVAIVSLGLIIFSYSNLEVFREDINRTIWFEPGYHTGIPGQGTGLMGIDDGSRLWWWKNEGSKILDDPIVGRGFFHRGGLSGLRWEGSHNFFVQMFLETGIFGGSIVMIILLIMWRQSGKSGLGAGGVELPVKAGLIAAMIGGMSGEYFYGGMGLLTLMLVYAAVGRLPLEPEKSTEVSRDTINEGSYGHDSANEGCVIQ
ncbi:MAG: O-antigen ligase family protein [Nitrospirota bacterium]|nr:MAG: O-antigen ligase family protein [Nitrospirota bacterium]